MELSGPGDRDTALFISCVSGKEETVSSWRLGHLQKHPSSYERKKGKRKLGETREEQKNLYFHVVVVSFSFFPRSKNAIDR